MTQIVAFTPPPNQPFQFQATLDGTVYTVTVPWNLYRRDYYIQIADLSGAVIYAPPLVASPVNFDISLCPPGFTNKLVYREQSAQFEVI